MLDIVTKCYEQFRLVTYRSMFRLLRERDSTLSAAEAFAVDVIYLLKQPTIKQFADCLGISQPNATYKVNNLIQKGYVTKIPSLEDRREMHLQVTEKYMRYWQEGSDALAQGLRQLEERFTPQEQALFAQMICTLVDVVPNRTANL